MGSSPRQILVVDDDPQIVELLTFVLEGEGYQVRAAADGRAALRQVDEELPDLIVLDMKMPVMDGWQFVREFRARYEHSVPIVVLTASEDASKRAEEIGAAAWVGKPFDIDVLAETVQQHLLSA